MRKIMKRGFCLFLVAVLLAGLVPYAFADEAKPTDVSEDAAEPTEETTAPPETTVPSESTEPPSEATEPPVTTEATEPDADPVEDDMEDDRLLSDSISTYASTVSNVLLFDQASPNCTTLVSGPHTTDSSGKISITGLNAGTYYVKELGHSDSSISSRYTCSGDNPQKVSVSNGATATVSFYNKLAVGALEIRKSTNTGNHLDGWKFIVKKDGEEIPGSPFTTDETGIIRISDLAPGKYVVLESTTDDPYWTMELGSAIAAKNPSAVFPRNSRSGIWKNTVSRNGSFAQETALNPCHISPKTVTGNSIWDNPRISAKPI